MRIALQSQKGDFDKEIDELSEVSELKTEDI